MEEKQHIILYTSDICERCKIVKKMLDAHSVDYDEITDRQIILSQDFESVPVIQIGDKIIDNYVNVLSWLRKNGYYSFDGEGENV